MTGAVLADTSANIVAAPSEQVASQYPDGGQENNLYYNNYVEDPYNTNGYYDYASQDSTFFAPQATQQGHSHTSSASTSSSKSGRFGKVFLASLLTY